MRVELAILALGLCLALSIPSPVGAAEGPTSAPSQIPTPPGEVEESTSEPPSESEPTEPVPLESADSAITEPVFLGSPDICVCTCVCPGVNDIQCVPAFQPCAAYNGTSCSAPGCLGPGTYRGCVPPWQSPGSC